MHPALYPSYQIFELDLAKGGPMSALEPRSYPMGCSYNIEMQFANSMVRVAKRIIRNNLLMNNFIFDDDERESEESVQSGP